MKRFLITIATTLLSLSLHARIECDIPGGKVPWIGKFPEEIGRNYRFVILADRTGGGGREVFAPTINEVNALSPDFVINVGDLIDGYVSDHSFAEAQWKEALDIIGKLEAPMFLVGGNHDLSNKMQIDDWLARFGRTYYHFTVGDDLFLVLNTEEQGGGRLSEEQIAYFKPIIESFSGRWIYVFMHRSLWIRNNGGFETIAALLKGRNHTVISGHEHAYYMEDRDGMKYIQVATTGGSSQMRGIHVGEFDHYLHVTTKDEGPVIANITTGGQLPIDIVSPRTYPYVRTITEHKYATVHPILLETAVQNEFTIDLETVNPMDTEMYFTADTPYVDGFEFSEKHIEQTIAPHETVIFHIVVTNLKRIPASDFPCMKIKTTCGYIINGDLVSLPYWHQIFTDWPHTVPTHIDCTVPYYVKEDWDWHSPDDGWFTFDIYIRKNKLVIAVAMHDDITIPADPKDPSKPFDHVTVFLESGGKKFTWTLNSDGEVTLPLGKIKNRSFLFNINFTDSDEVRNTKPSVIWWRKNPVKFTY